MKATEQQLIELENSSKIKKGENYPWGEVCPNCKRPYFYEYEDGTKVCSKCDEIKENEKKEMCNLSD